VVQRGPAVDDSEENTRRCGGFEGWHGHRGGSTYLNDRNKK
jgi:hypothetical protein